MSAPVRRVKELTFAFALGDAEASKPTTLLAALKRVTIDQLDVNLAGDEATVSVTTDPNKSDWKQETVSKTVTVSE